MSGARRRRTAARPRRGPPPTRAPSDALIDKAVNRSRAGRVALPDVSALSNEVIDELLAGARTEQEIAGPGGCWRR